MTISRLLASVLHKSLQTPVLKRDPDWLVGPFNTTLAPVVVIPSIFLIWNTFNSNCFIQHF